MRPRSLTAVPLREWRCTALGMPETAWPDVSQRKPRPTVPTAGSIRALLLKSFAGH